MSIRKLILIVACIGVDCSVLRLTLFNPGWGGGVGVIGALGFANLLAIAAERLVARRGNRPFLIGFVVSGTMVLAIFLILCLFVPWSWSHRLDEVLTASLMSIRPFRYLAEHVEQSSIAFAVLLAVGIICFNAIISIPLALIAFAGGWFTMRLKASHATRANPAA